MAEESPYLTEVRRLPDQRKLGLTWNDGYTAELDYDTLRGYCPCASCQGHGPGPIEFHKPPQPVTPVEIEPVGNYAISIAWSDQHATGIYRFEFLREMAGGDALSRAPLSPNLSRIRPSRPPGRERHRALAASVPRLESRGYLLVPLRGSPNLGFAYGSPEVTSSGERVGPSAEAVIPESRSFRGSTP